MGSEYKEEISNLSPGEAIICGDVIKRMPLYVKIRRRTTAHGGTGFNPLDFLSDKTVEDLKKKRLKVLETKSQDKLHEAESIFDQIISGKKGKGSNQEVTFLRNKVKDLETEIKLWKDKFKKQKERADKAIDLAERSIDKAKEAEKD